MGLAVEQAKSAQYRAFSAATNSSAANRGIVLRNGSASIAAGTDKRSDMKGLQL